jgi:hypothetical protein
MTERPESLPDGAAPTAEELERLFALEAGPEPARAHLTVPLPPHRAYPGRDTSEHARRLLRRAVNPDRPGEETLRLLAAARAYDIERLPEPRDRVTAPARWCSLYQHAFLLADDREVCLYELEHDATPDRRLVCEVYPDATAADRAARRLAAAAEGDPA